jgi:peptidoglycan/LPS O-acetylase OafA/YrhL
VESTRSADLKSGVFHLRSLTGLRFVAAFVVFASHLQHFLFPEVRNVPVGGAAVSFFFVLSGFILTYVYGERLDRQRIPRFWFTRWARLWPLHFVCFVIAICLLGELPGSDAAGRNSVASGVAQLLMLHSWIPVRYWFTDFNAVSWSISTELFFYLCFPLLLLGRPTRVWLKLLAAFVLSFACLAWFQYLLNTQSAPVWLDPVAVAVAFPAVRLAEFATGMATCLLMQRLGTSFARAPAGDRRGYLRDSLWEILAIVIVLVGWLVTVKWGFIHYLMQSPHFGQLYSIWMRVAGGLFGYALLIFVFASRRGLIGQIMASRLAVWLGEISFAFYLIHQIVIIRLERLALNDVPFAVYAFGLALLASALLYRIVELPSRSALLAVYDGRAGWFHKLTAGLRGAATTRMGRFQAVALVLLLGLLWLRPVDEVNRQICLDITASTPVSFRNVVFAEEATLLGFEADRVERGVRLRLAWKRFRTRSRKRFLHICDADGNIVAQGRLEERVFRNHQAHQPFFEEVVVHKRKIRNAAYIAVGFWSQELACARVRHEAAEMGSCRLPIVDLETLR